MALEQSFVRGVVPAPWEIAKSNFSRARCEELQVVRTDQKLELIVSTPCGRVTGGSPLARGLAVTLGLPQQGLSGWQTTDPWDKNHRVIIFPLVCNLHTQACIYSFIYCACIVALVYLVCFSSKVVALLRN
jgi:hypothetical protein